MKLSIAEAMKTSPMHQIFRTIAATHATRDFAYFFAQKTPYKFAHIHHPSILNFFKRKHKQRKNLKEMSQNS